MSKLNNSNEQNSYQISSNKFHQQKMDPNFILINNPKSHKQLLLKLNQENNNNNNNK